MSLSMFITLMTLVLARLLCLFATPPRILCDTHFFSQIGVVVVTFDIMLRTPSTEWFHPTGTCATKLTASQASSARAEVLQRLPFFTDHHNFKHLLLQDLPKEWVAPDFVEKGRTAFVASIHIAVKHAVHRFHSGYDKQALQDIWKTLNVEQRRQFLYGLMTHAPNMECIRLPHSFKFPKAVFPE